SRYGKDVLQLGREPSVAVSRVGVVFLWLIRRLGREECGIIRSLAMKQRDEAVVGEVLLTAIGDSDLGGAFHRDLALVGLKGVGRKALNKATALYAANGDAPAVHRKGLGQPGAESVSSIAPQIFLVVGAVDIFLEAEGLCRFRCRAIGLT